MTDQVVPRRRPPTMVDVAALAQVSHQTVSRVLNGSDSIRPGTRDRVQMAVRTLGYRRNSAARLLASSHSRLIGFLGSGREHFGPARLLYGLETAAAESGHSVAPVDVRDMSHAALTEAIDRLLGQSIEALVVNVPHHAALHLIEDLQTDVPIVLVGRGTSEQPAVDVDHSGGARAATEYLLSLGHQTVVHLGGPRQWQHAVARQDGWRAALRAADRVISPVLCGDWTPRSGYELGLSLARDRDITAVFAANDQMAIGLMRALSERGRRVPEDVSVVGFDDIPEGAYLNCPLTTVRQPFEELGSAIMAVVHETLDGSDDPGAAQGRSIPATMVLRHSAGPPA